MFSSASVCLLVCKQDYAKNNQPVVTKFGVEKCHIHGGPRMKPFSGTSDRVTWVRGRAGYGNG